MTPTQEDREAAARVWVQNLLRGDPCPDWLMYAFMRHRLAAEERGARMALDAAAKVAEPPLMHRKGAPGLWRTRRAAIATAIRQIDPASLGAE
jgi:hypothetical protein